MKEEKFIFRRIVAGLIDYSIVFVFIFIYVSIFGKINDDGTKSVDGIKTLPALLLWFIYICVIEMTFGSTFGNFVVRLKPVDLETRKEITLKQSFLRHIVDPIDMFFFGIVGIILIKNSENNQRLGDILAKTSVIIGFKRFKLN